MNENIQINLSKEEAIVLFDFLSRFSDNDKLEIVDAAENRVLWDMLCGLEKTLVEPFATNYPEILKTARRKISRQE